MSMTDPIADLLARVRNGAQRAQGLRRLPVVGDQGAHRPRAGGGGLSAATAAWSSSTRARRICACGCATTPAAPGDHRPQARQPAERARSTSAPTRCRRCAAAWASASSRRRSASWSTARRRAATSAARCSARSGRDDHVTNRQAAHHDSQGRDGEGRRRHGRGRGPEGKIEHAHPAGDRRSTSQDGATSVRTRRATQRKCAALHGLTRRLIANMRHRRQHGLHAHARDRRRRLSRRGRRAARCSSASATRIRSSISCRRASTPRSTGRWS